MLIKYKAEEINLENQPIVSSDTENINSVFIPSFTITDLAYDSDFIYGNVYGDISKFTELNVDNYTEIDSIPTSNIEFFIEKKWKNPSSIDEILKLQLRSKIEEEIGDTEDVLADLFKRVSLIERLLMYAINDILTNSPESVPMVNTHYKSFVLNYIGAIQSNQELNVADLEDPTELFQKLMERSVKTTKLVKENYTDKKTGQ